MSVLSRLALDRRPALPRLAQALPLERPLGNDPEANALEEMLRRYLAE